jgi:hypothetical protein
MSRGWQARTAARMAAEGRSMAADARALLVDLYGTEGPERCRYTLSMPFDSPAGAGEARQAVERAPIVAPEQGELF